MVDGSSSKPAAVISGVPQGSVLGPVIFLVLLGDINAEVQNSSVSSFADDTRVSKSIYPESKDDDRDLLENDLSLIYKWSDTNNMVFNDSKFEHIHYGTKIKNDESNPHCYCGPSGLKIEQKTSVKDLGVMLDCTGRFTSHITTLIQ